MGAICLGIIWLEGISFLLSTFVTEMHRVELAFIS
jgi:hypothetical protein